MNLALFTLSRPTLAGVLSDALNGHQIVLSAEWANGDPIDLVDANIQHMAYDPSSDSFICIVECSAFDPTREGAVLELIEARIKVVVDEKEPTA